MKILKNWMVRRLNNLRTIILDLLNSTEDKGEEKWLFEWLSEIDDKLKKYKENKNDFLF